jgi:hypothetical protein
MKHPRFAFGLSASKLLTVALALGVGLACAGQSRTPNAKTPDDPVQTDGDKYRVLLDNAEVRVLRYADRPGEKTHLHHHPCFVLYALGPFERRLTFADGTQKVREFRAGEVTFMPEQTHIGENVGEAPTDALLVELKAPCKQP